MAHKYSTKIEENCAKAVGISLPISLKKTVMVCASIRGKPIDKVKVFLEDVSKMKKAVPFTRFNRDMGHRKGMAAGRFPVKTSKHVLDIVKSAESNAQFKGLGADLIVKHACAHKGPTTWHFGRFRRRKAKRTHLEIVLAEVKKAEEKPKKQAPKKPVEKKEQKLVEKKEEPKKQPEPKKEDKPVEKKAEPKSEKEVKKE